LGGSPIAGAHDSIATTNNFKVSREPHVVVGCATEESSVFVRADAGGPSLPNLKSEPLGGLDIE
jgi:hypothetical protein